MATGFVGQAWVQISPSFEGFQKAVGSEITKQLKGAGEEGGTEAGKTTGNAFANGLKKAGAGIGKAVNGISNAVVDVGGIAATAMVGFGIKAAKAGEEANTLAAVMEVVGKNTGVGGKAIQTTAQQVQGMGVDFQTADKFATGLARAHLSLTNATKLTTIAQNAGIVSGQSTSDALAAINKGIMTLQPRQLKAVGLTVDAASAYKEEAKQLGIKSSQLTITQKRQALMNAVMQSGQSINGAYAKALEEPKVSLNLMRVAFENITATIGQTFEPAIGKALKPFAELVLKIQTAIQPGGKLRPIVDAIGQGLSRMITPLGNIATKMGNWIDALKAPQIQMFADWLKHNLPMIAKVGGALSLLAGKNLLGGVPVIGQLISKFNPLLGILVEIVATNPKLREEFMKLVDAIKPMIPPLIEIVNQFTKDLLPVLQELLDQLLPIVVWVLQLVDAFWKLIAPIKPLATLVGGILVAAFIGLKMSLIGDPWFWVVAGLILAFVELWKISKPLAIAIFGIAAAVFVLVVAFGILDSIPIVAIVVAILVAVIALIVGIIWLIKNWRTVWKAITNALSVAWDAIKGVFETIGRFFQGIYDNYIKPVFDAIVTAWHAVGDAFDWVYKNVIKPTVSALVGAWNDVANAISWAWNNIIQPILKVMSIVFKVWFALTIAPVLIAINALWTATAWAFDWAWTNILKPTISAIGSFFQWWWKNIVQPVFNFFSSAWHDAVAYIQWVWNTILKPTFNEIAAQWNAAVAFIQKVWNVVLHPVVNAIASAFSWFWNTVLHPIFNAIGSVWSGMANGIKWAWDHTINFVLQQFQSGIKSARDVFTTAVDVIGKAWDGLKGAVETPVKWVVNTIINPLINGANGLLSKIGMKVDPIKMAQGGRVPGGWGGGDTQAALLEPGEWVLTKRQARAIGYSQLSNLPRYREGGPVGEFLHPRLSIPSWSNPVNWGKGLANAAGKAFGFAGEVFDKATGLIRFAAATAFEAFTEPLVSMLNPVAKDDAPPLWFNAVIAKLGLKVIKGTIDLIKGKSETAEAGANSEVANNVVQNALSRLGSPYVWGARGPSVFDCSGLIDWSFGTSGTGGQPHLPTGWTGKRVGPTTEQQRVMGRQIPENQASPGDLWFIGNPVHHVAMSLGGQQIVHAPQTGDVVKKASIWHSEATMLRRLIEAVATSASSPVAGIVENLRGVVQQAFKVVGKPANDDWVNWMLTLIQHESGGNPNAQNNWDINAKNGDPSRGLTQMIMGTFLAYHVPGTSGNIFDPLANIAASIMYIWQRYGNIMNLPGVASVARGGGWIGYARGGRIPGGWGGGDSVPALLEPGEWVLTKYQAAALGYDRLRNLPHYALGGEVAPTPINYLNDPANWIGGQQASAPAIHISNAQFNEPVDVNLLMAQAEWAVRSGRL